MNNLIDFFTKVYRPIKYIKIVIFFIGALVVFHAVTWNFYTKQILNYTNDHNTTHYAGDLSRLGYQPSSASLRPYKKITLKNEHIEIKDWKNQYIPIVTIGDSFSNAGAKGINPYYQDYLTTYTGLNVMNITTYKNNPEFIPIILSLLNDGVFKKMKTKVILIESIERYTVGRFIKNFNWDEKRSSKYLFNRHLNHSNTIINNNITFINNGNYKFVYNTMVHQLSKQPKKASSVYNGSLSKKLFSAKASSSLLFFDHAIENIKNSTPQNLNKLNNNLNHLARILKKEGITLMFMPVVDKYNLYYPYILDNNLPKSKFFELLEPLDREYYFVNTKKILRKVLPETKDVYYADDTHWNYLASELIMKSISLQIIN